MVDYFQLRFQVQPTLQDKDKPDFEEDEDPPRNPGQAVKQPASEPAPEPAPAPKVEEAKPAEEKGTIELLLNETSTEVAEVNGTTGSNETITSTSVLQGDGDKPVEQAVTIPPTIEPDTNSTSTQDNSSTGIWANGFVTLIAVITSFAFIGK